MDPLSNCQTNADPTLAKLVELFPYHDLLQLSSVLSIHNGSIEAASSFLLENSNPIDRFEGVTSYEYEDDLPVVEFLPLEDVSASGTPKTEKSNETALKPSSSSRLETESISENIFEKMENQIEGEVPLYNDLERGKQASLQLGYFGLLPFELKSLIMQWISAKDVLSIQMTCHAGLIFGFQDFIWEDRYRFDFKSSDRLRVIQCSWMKAYINAYRITQSTTIFFMNFGPNTPFNSWKYMKNKLMQFQFPGIRMWQYYPESGRIVTPSLQNFYWNELDQTLISSTRLRKYHYNASLKRYYSTHTSHFASEVKIQDFPPRYKYLITEPGQIPKHFEVIGKIPRALMFALIFNI